MASLSLVSIINYANFYSNPINFQEAETLSNSNLITSFEITEVTEDEFDILALCHETCSMKDAHYRINGNLVKKSNDLKIGHFHCTCAAGVTVCKHKIAVLLLYFRFYLNDITERNYELVPISEFFEERDDILPNINPETIPEILDEVSPNSLWAQNFGKLPERKQDEDQDLSPLNLPKSSDENDSGDESILTPKKKCDDNEKIQAKQSIKKRRKENVTKEESQKKKRQKRVTSSSPGCSSVSSTDSPKK